MAVELFWDMPAEKWPAQIQNWAERADADCAAQGLPGTTTLQLLVGRGDLEDCTGTDATRAGATGCENSGPDRAARGGISLHGAQGHCHDTAAAGRRLVIRTAQRPDRIVRRKADIIGCLSGPVRDIPGRLSGGGPCARCPRRPSRQLPTQPSWSGTQPRAEVPTTGEQPAGKSRAGLGAFFACHSESHAFRVFPVRPSHGAPSKRVR